MCCINFLKLLKYIFVLLLINNRKASARQDILPSCVFVIKLVYITFTGTNYMRDLAFAIARDAIRSNRLKLRFVLILQYYQLYRVM